MKNEIVLFTDGDINIEVELSPELETVWLTQKQMGELFEVKQATLSEHINNIISSGELDETSIGFPIKVPEDENLRLVAITLMIAESRPEEKDIMVNLVMIFLTM